MMNRIVSRSPKEEPGHPSPGGGHYNSIFSNIALITFLCILCLCVRACVCVCASWVTLEMWFMDVSTASSTPPTSPHGGRRPRARPASVSPGRVEGRGRTWTLCPPLEVRELEGKSPHCPPACVCLPLAAAGDPPPNVSLPIHHHSGGVLHDRLTLNYDTLCGENDWLVSSTGLLLLKCTIHWFQCLSFIFSVLYLNCLNWIYTYRIWRCGIKINKYKYLTCINKQ